MRTTKIESHETSGKMVQYYRSVVMVLELSARPSRRLVSILYGSARSSRKSAGSVLREFMRLWDEGSHARLIMIGHCEPAAREEGELMHQLLHEKRFRHIRDATDATIRECFRHARALIYPSKYEGFGLPPIEALHAGVPVVVWRGLRPYRAFQT